MSQSGIYDISAIIVPVQTLTGNIGGAITPVAGNIDLLGGNNITSTGTPGTITFNLTGTTTSAVQIGNATGSLTSLAAAGNGELVIGSVGVDPVIAAPTNGANITWTLGAGTLQADLTGTTQYAVQLGNATGSLDSLAIGLAGQILQSSGAGVNPAWSTTTYPATSAIGDVIYGSAANTLTALAFDATATRYLANTGGGATIPAWDQINLTNGVTGTLPVASGGTGVATITQFALLEGDGTNPINEIAPGTDGQIVIAATGAVSTFASLTSTGGTIIPTVGANTLNLEVGPGMTIDSGFAAWDGAGPYFDDTVLGDFEVSQSGYGYINGVRVDWAAPQTETGMTAGNTYIIYIDNTGTIQKTTAFSQALFQNNIVLFECLRDSTAAGNIQTTVKENHPYDFQPAVSYWAHEAIGVLIENHNNGANITLNGTQKIQINGADDLSDHGLYTDIPDSGGVAEVFNQYFTLVSGKWARYAQSDTFDGEWDNAGTATAIGANKYTVSRLYVSKDNLNVATPVYFSVLGDALYNNLTAAQTAIANGTIPAISGELAQLEIAQLGYIIFEESSTSIVDVIIAKETLTNTIVLSGTNQASLVLTDTTNFDHILTIADTNVQQALETIDELTLEGDAGTCLAAAGTFTIAGGTNIATAAAGSTVTVNFDGTLPVTSGGTGVATFTTAYAVVCAGTTATNPLQPTASAGNAGEVLTSNGAAALPTYQTLSGGIAWSVITANQTIVVDEGYVCNKAGVLALALPATSAVGTVFRVTGMNQNLGWSVTQAANQQIHFGDVSTTVGAGGSLASTLIRDSIECVCVVADLEWNVVSSLGNVTIV